MGFFNERYNDQDVTARKNMRNLIVDEVEENVITIQPIYEAIKEHPKTDKEEICKMLEL